MIRTMAGLTTHILLGSILFLLPGAGSPTSILDSGEQKARTEGYSTVINREDGFLAAGSGGRIDWISASGTVIRSESLPGIAINSLLLVDRNIIAAGDEGLLMVSTAEGGVRRIECGTRNDLNSIVFFRGKVLAGASGGMLVSGELNGPFRTTRLPLKGDVVSLSATAQECFGVTGEGEIIRSADGIKWEVLDFNGLYEGYYGTCGFTRILATENRIAVAGVKSDGSPVLFLSHLGSVWNERPLDYTDDQGTPGYLTGIPNDIFYDSYGDRFFLACDQGMVINLPPCSQCNKLTVIAGEDLKGITGNGHTLAIAGGNFYIKTLNLR